MPPISLICFDLGGVIIRHCRSWAEGCAAAGLPLHEECNTPEASAARKRLAAAVTQGTLGQDEFYRRMSETTRPAGGEPRYTPEHVRAIRHSWLGDEYEGVHEVVGDLMRGPVARGRVRAGILSNTNPAHWARIESEPAYRTARLIPHRFASHLLRLAKPDPAIFRRFEDQTGIPGPEILFFEDMPENLAAAQAAGWNTVPIDHTGDTAAQIREALTLRGML
jgi:FMN phosphatase YigB (HAD superfamily)